MPSRVGLLQVAGFALERQLRGCEIRLTYVADGSAPGSQHAPDRSLSIKPRSPPVERLLSDELRSCIPLPVEWPVLIEAAAKTAGREWL